MANKQKLKSTLGNIWQGLKIAAILLPSSLLLIYALKQGWFSVINMIFTLAIICILMGIVYAICGVVLFAKNNINKYDFFKKYIGTSLFMIALGLVVIVL